MLKRKHCSVVNKKTKLNWKQNVGIAKCWTKIFQHRKRLDAGILFSLDGATTTSTWDMMSEQRSCTGTISPSEVDVESPSMDWDIGVEMD